MKYFTVRDIKNMIIKHMNYVDTEEGSFLDPQEFSFLLGLLDDIEKQETKENIMWTKIPTEILNEDCQHIMEIIDDASVHGLNFKYVNGEWYFGETQGVPK